MRALLLAVGLVALPGRAFDQQVEHWHNLNVVGRIAGVGETQKSPALYYLEVQPRVLLSDLAPEEVIFRAALGWEIAPQLIVMAGAASIPEFETPIWVIHETRTWQQIGYSQNLDRLNLSLRGRLEERLFAEQDGNLRARAMMRAAFKLPVLDNKLSLLTWNETFVVFDPQKTKDYDAFEQNRVFVGVSYKFVPSLSVEIGYVNVMKGFLKEDSGLVRHVFAVNTSFNLL